MIPRGTERDQGNHEVPYPLWVRRQGVLHFRLCSPALCFHFVWNGRWVKLAAWEWASLLPSVLVSVSSTGAKRVKWHVPSPRAEVACKRECPRLSAEVEIGLRALLYTLPPGQSPAVWSNKDGVQRQRGTQKILVTSNIHPCLIGLSCSCFPCLSRRLGLSNQKQ